MSRDLVTCHIRVRNGENVETEFPDSTRISDILHLFDQPNGTIIYAGSRLDNDAVFSRTESSGKKIKNLLGI